MQYLIGLPGFQQEPPFDPSLMVHFRKRLGPDGLSQINEWTNMPQEEDKEDDEHEPKDGPGERDVTAQETTVAETTPESVPRQGKLLLDATCAPADISYPADLSLLNEASEKLEDIDIQFTLSRWQYKTLLVIQEWVRPQIEMYREREHRVGDRIVSISQPHVRPMVRGKAKVAMEFGRRSR